MPDSCQKHQARKHDMCPGHTFITPNTGINYSFSGDVPSTP
uniref:ORF40i n=1 Tax=Pinus koraiensis TaxID=88728 RepID=Q85X11_PINKO|nr:ORF40i [Pinus koraiensis]